MDWQALTESQSALAVIPLKLRELAERRDVAKGETLFRLGEPLRRVFCVLAGEVRLTRHARGGMQIVLQRSRGGFFAEASLHANAYHCDAVVAESGAILRFPARAFRDALADDAAFRDAWMSRLARELLKSRAQCERLGLRTAAERVVHYIESEGAGGSVTLTMSRKAWAAELGLSHEALYRALSRLRAERALAIEGNRIALAQAKPAARRR